MADIAALEQRFEGITVQDENVDSNAPKQHKAKVRMVTSTAAVTSLTESL